MVQRTKEERRRANQPVSVAIAVGALAVCSYAGDASAAGCRQVRETTPETHFEGQKCQSNGLIQLNGRYHHLYTGERLEGTVVKQRRTSGVSIRKKGNLKSPMFEGVLTANSQVDNHGIISSEEGRYGMEDMGAEGRFEGEMITRRVDKELDTYRKGYLRSPTHELSLRARSHVNRDGLISSNHELNGTWMVGNRRFVGSLVIKRIGNEVTVRDERREDL